VIDGPVFYTVTVLTRQALVVLDKAFTLRFCL